MRRLSTVGLVLVAMTVLLGVVASDVLAVSASASSPAQDSVSVVKISGRLDPVLADFLERSIDDAKSQRRTAIVLQLNSKGSLISDQRVIHLAQKIHDSPVPVAVWVGPSGASAFGASAQLAGASSRIGLAPGSTIGNTGHLVVPTRWLQPNFLAARDRLEHGTIGSKEARTTGIAAKDAPVIGQLIIDLPGVGSKVVTSGGRTRREPTTTPVFSALPITSQLLHTVSSPEVAYLLFVIGMALILFELFTAGVGVAGLVGAGFFTMGCYGLAVLPVRSWAIGLLVFAMVAYAIDVQTGVPRVWTGIGTFCFVVGSLTLYNGLTQSWITLLVGIVGITLAMLAGMPSMVRTRFSTPTIGREWMVGEAGEAVADVSPDGVVKVRDALWRARTNRATPITAGAAIRVVGIEGLLLEVEPESGGAKDHRERRRPS